MKTKSKLLRRFSALMLAFMLCLSCIAAPNAFALESSASEPAATSETSSAVESQASSKSAEPEPVTDSVPGDTAEDEAENEGTVEEKEAELSAEAQSFISAVDALDRESILAAVNSWALASHAWQADICPKIALMNCETCTALPCKSWRAVECWWSAARKSAMGCRWRSASLKNAISFAPLSPVLPKSRKTPMWPPTKGYPYFSQGVADFASIAFGYPNALLGRTPNPRQPSPLCSSQK